MQQIWLILGVTLLLAAGGITLLLRHRANSGSYRTKERYCRTRSSMTSLKWLKRAARFKPCTAEVEFLQDHLRPLAEHILQLRIRLRGCPALPAGANGEPRLMTLAHDAADEGTFTETSLLHLLKNWEHIASPSEVAALPLLTAAAQCQRLKRVLQAICSDAAERRAASRTLRRLIRSKQPAVLLRKSALRSLGIAELAKLIRAQAADSLLPIFEEWIASHGLTIDTLHQHSVDRQVRLMEELRRAADCFDRLSRMNWLPCCAEADVLHPLLMKDPSGVYPDLTPDSQLALRTQAERLSRHTRVDTEEILHQKLALSDSQSSATIEHTLSYWLQNPAGLAQLYSILPSKRGRLYVFLAARKAALKYAFLWCFGVISGFVFLQAHSPVFMLPFFALVIGHISRWLIRHFPEQPLPRKTLHARDAAMLRTLVVLPAVLDDPHEAIRMIRRIKTLMHTFPQQVDFLLLGDFAPAITPVTSSDQAIIQAVLSAAAALNDPRVMYLQRSRVWLSKQHCYGARGGSLGAITEICRLIAQGECGDTFASASVEPALFERTYAYVLSVPADGQPAPGMYETLLETMAHPLCGRHPVGTAWQGYAVLTPTGCEMFDGVGLIRPDSFLEAIDGFVAPDSESPQLCGELAGQASVPDAKVHRPAAAATYEIQYQQALQAWHLLPWQLPLVQTPAGLVTNPLSRAGRFRLRELLRSALVPLGEFALLLYAILTQKPILLLIALSASVAGTPFRHLQDAVHMLCKLSLLPTNTIIPLFSLLNLIRRKTDLPAWATIEVWTQGIAATLLTALSLVLPGSFVPALSLGVLFACFPLAHLNMNSPVTSGKGLTVEQLTFLEKTASSTWRYFQDSMQAGTCYLPPVATQIEPPLGPEACASPESIGSGLLACVCACELGLVSALDAAERISLIADSLAKLPLPFGLPCHRYALPALTVADARTETRGCGFLLCALMTTAQALRTWLPALSEAHLPLSGRLEELADRFEINRLFDPKACLFYAGMDENGQPAGYIDSFSDESLLLSVAACARNIIPPEHFSHLRRTQVRAGGETLPLSYQGTAAAHLLTGLFLPADNVASAAFIRAMKKHGRNGLWGQSESGCYAFDPHLRYRKKVFGLKEAASVPVSVEPVYTPYAAALGLPHMPREATEALMQFEHLGAMGPHGFNDAIDLNHGPWLIMLHDAYHQGLILAALTHLLADAPIRRYFCAIPQVEACLPLLDPTSDPLLLPVLPVHRPVKAIAPIEEYRVNPQILPAQAHLLGTPDFRMIVNSAGDSLIHDGALPLTRYSGEAPFGLQFFLADEGRSFRIGSPAASPEVIFTPGEVRFEQLCGSLKVELICTVDTIRKRALHILTITNLSTRDRQVELADVLFPDLEVHPSTLQAEQAAKDHLCLHARGTDMSLHHMVQTLTPPLVQCACTDADIFLGRNDTWHRPAFLNEPIQDHVLCTTTPCLAFRLRMSLGGRGQISAWFTTSLTDSEPPQFSELPGLRRLGALQHTAIDHAAALSTEQIQVAHRLLMHAVRNDFCMTLALKADVVIHPLAELCGIRRWMHQHGLALVLYVLCPEDVRELLPAEICEQVIFLPESASPRGLLLDGQLPLSVQLDALQATFPSLAESKAPVPALLPRQSLQHRSTYGGFDAETSDFIVELEPGQSTPLPWENRHTNRYYTETVDESGLRFPFHEQVWITQRDGTLLSPWSEDLPRTIRMGLGESSWEAWSDKHDLRLSTGCLPGHRCALRVMRIRNASGTPESLTIRVLARLSSNPTSLDIAPGVVTCITGDHQKIAFIAGIGCEARRVTNVPSVPVSSLDLADSAQGQLAMLYCTLTLPPHASDKIIWLSGFARHNEDIARALSAVDATPPSEIFRTIRLEGTQRLSALSVSTPEDTLDLLINRILPAQSCSADTVLRMLPLLYLAPLESARTLLRAARTASSCEDYALLALLTEKYVRHTGDESILDVRLPSKDASLYQCCAESLSRLPLDRNKLPLGDEQALHCFLFAAAAHSLHSLRPNESLQAIHHKLLQAADAHLWHEGHYGDSLRLDVQSLALLAAGTTPRTRQAAAGCWDVLYNQPHGFVSSQPSADIPPLPGLPTNGGMKSIDAALFLHALIRTGQHDEAFELLRALNPLHHTDDPQRMNTFRCAPNRLHGGMYAAPMEPGRATPEGGDSAAALLYAVILEDILGIRRHGSLLQLTPCVPPEWDDFTLTLKEGASTWRISLERQISSASIDGKEFSGREIDLVDDGKIHQVHIPLQ